MGSISPNLDDYETTVAEFTWQEARAKLDGMGEGRLNIAWEALDSHMGDVTADRVALRFIPGHTERSRDITYRQLNERANQFANVLAGQGVEPGARVYGLCHRIPDFYAAVLGTLKHGCVFTPLFSAFGPEPVRERVEIGEPEVLVTTGKLYRKKVADWVQETPSLQTILLIDEVERAPAGTLDAVALLDEASADYATRAMDPEDAALLHFTSGTTGKPKGAIHVHDAVTTHHITGQYALDMHPGEIYWCTADPGWVTGTSYGIIAPLTNGVTMIVDEADFDAERWYRILQDQNVAIWYTAPTAIRMLMKAGPELVHEHDLSSLRFLASVGEPLNPEAVHWSRDVLGLAFHDNWWQTETGGIMIANYASMPIKAGSMGRPIPGVEAAVVKTSSEGLEFIDDPNETGELALKEGWPSMFRGYLHQQERYENSFVDGWLLTGDLAREDRDGYFWFVGRDDDVIKSSGHLIGPFEVESVLVEHPAVAEAGVIGLPDEVAGETVKAFVSLKPGYQYDDALLKELRGHARSRLGSAVAPREIEFRQQLPRTRSGKIMRRLLRARELGLPEGDTSTLEEGSDTE